MLIPFAIIVLSCLQSSLRIGARALDQKLSAYFCESPPGNASYPLDVLSLLSIAVLEAVVDGQGEVRDSLAVGSILEFRVGSGSPNENHFIDTNFWHLLS